MSSLFFFGFAFYFLCSELDRNGTQNREAVPSYFSLAQRTCLCWVIPPRLVLKLLKGSSSAAPATGRLNYKYEQKKCKKCTASTPSAEGTLRGLSLLYIYEVHEEQEPFNLHTHLGQSAVKRTESRNSSRITILPELARK